MQTAPSCIVILDDHHSKLQVAQAVGLIIFASLSMIAASFVAMLMYKNKQLMLHPNKLIFYMCISEAIAANASLYALISNKWVICYFNLNELYRATTFNVLTAEESFNTLRRSNNTMISYF
jgi:hypothetical protein